MSARKICFDICWKNLFFLQKIAYDERSAQLFCAVSDFACFRYSSYVSAKLSKKLDKHGDSLRWSRTNFHIAFVKCLSVCVRAAQVCIKYDSDMTEFRLELPWSQTDNEYSICFSRSHIILWICSVCTRSPYFAMKWPQGFRIQWILSFFPILSCIFAR